MPDDLATRAQLLLLLGLVAGLALIPVVGWIWRHTTGASEGSSAGTAVGAGLWAGCLLVAAVDFGNWAFDLRRGASAEGRLLGFVAETIELRRPGQTSIAGPRRERSVSPQIEFFTPDGQRHVVNGLGGSLAGRAPGDRVTVHYDPADPTRATTDDFQNQLGALAFFGWLGVIAASVSVWMGWGAVIDLLRERRVAPAQAGRGRRGRSFGPPPPTRWVRWRDGAGQAWRAPLQRAGVMCFVLALVTPFVLAEFDGLEMVAIFGLALFGVAVALACFGVRAALQPGVDSAHVLFGWLIGVFGFGGFALFLWALRSAPG